MIQNITSQNKIETDYIKDLYEKNDMDIVICDENKKVYFISNDLYRDFKYKYYYKIEKINDNFLYISDKEFTVQNKQYILFIFNNITNEVTDFIRLSKILLLVNVVGFLFAILMGIGKSKKILQPINEMTDTVKNISTNNLSIRLNVSGSKDELKELAKTFNEMLSRIENQYIKQQQFVSDASHELRTPIAVLQGYIDMLKRWGKDDEAVLAESIDAIKNETDNMKDLVEKLLFLARHDRNTLNLKKEEFSLTELVYETGKETEIIDNNHKIIVDIKGEVSIKADRNRTKQALRVFIDNAIKYTPNGGEIYIKLEADKDFAYINIKDSGIGISKEDLSHIFDRFYRSDKSRTKNSGGHGLGLSIAKIIILGHGGKIKIRSKVGEGTEFIISLQLK
jgi:heavy metal sensor kinase